MSKCQYIPQAKLPATATDTEIAAIPDALSTRSYSILETAKSHVRLRYRMTGHAFAQAILAHIKSNHLLFVKTVETPPENTVFFSANVRLDPDSDSEDDDIYVEIRLVNRRDVFIRDTHEHPSWKPRLPKRRS